MRRPAGDLRLAQACDDALDPAQRHPSCGVLVAGPDRADEGGRRRVPTVFALGVAGVLALSAGVAALAFAAVPALAAAPEAPDVTVEAVMAGGAIFHGVLNPIEAAEPNNLGGTYEFLYKASKTGCTGGSVTKPLGLAFGGVHEEVFKQVSGLAANTDYMVCLSVTNLEGETTVGLPAAFKTAIPPEKPETSEPATHVTATSAKLEGILNPHSTRKVGGYFAYSDPGGSSCTEGPTVGLEEFEGEKEEKAIAVHATVGLEPDRTYRVCLVATDERGEPTPGNEMVVETLAPPPVVVSESAPALVVPAPVTGVLEATLSATVDPNNQVTECHFQYGVASVSEHEVTCEQGSVTGVEQGVSVTVTGLLHLERVYHYRVVLKNAKGEEVKGAEEKLETLFSPSGLQTGAPEEVTGSGAKLGGKLDAGGEAEYYVEYSTVPCSANSCGTKSEATRVSGKVQECTLGGVLQECVTPIVVSGLEPSTTYHYWLVANNGAVSEPVHGAAGEFTTKVAAPSPKTGLAEDITPTSARFTGELNPGGGESEYYVEYLSSSNTSGKTSAAFASGKAKVSVAPLEVSGLEPNTTYYYWLVASNSAVSEPVHGEAHTFTTPLSHAEEEAQEAANRRPAEELAAATAAKQKLAEEETRRAQETAAANAAKQTQYEEIEAQSASREHQEALEELIADTSVSITKTKLGAGVVRVTIASSQAGTVTITGTGVKKTVAKVAAGTHTLAVALTSAGRSARKHHKTSRVTVTLKTSVTTVSASTAVKL